MENNDNWNNPGGDSPAPYGYGAPPAYPPAYPSAGLQLPSFCKAIAIVDLILGALRLLIVPFSIIGYFVLPDDDPLKMWVVPEVMVGLMVGVAAVVADGGMLMKKRWAVTAGYVNIAAMLLSVVFALIQMPTSIESQKAQMPDPAMQDAVMIGVVVGVLIALAVKATLMVLLFKAISKYKDWLAAA